MISAPTLEKNCSSQQPPKTKWCSYTLVILVRILSSISDLADEHPKTPFFTAKQRNGTQEDEEEDNDRNILCLIQKKPKTRKTKIA